MKISIIIPIYKVEYFVHRCIESVLNQTYRDLEVILVNDCTPDHSMELAKSIIAKSDNTNGIVFQYIEHSINKGISAARNSGIDVAKGEYLYFLDSDDEILPDCISSFVDIARKYPNVEYIYGGAIMLNRSVNQKQLPKCLPEYTQDADIIHHDMECNMNGGIVTAWNKLIRRDLVLKNKLYFKEGIIHEDVHWRLVYRKHIHSIATNMNLTYVYHVDNMTSICRGTGYDLRKIFSHFVIMKDYIPTIDDNRYYVPYLLDTHSLVRRVKLSLEGKNSYRVMNEYRETLSYLIKSAKIPCRVKLLLKYMRLPDFFVYAQCIILIGRCMGLRNLSSHSFFRLIFYCMVLINVI